MIAKDTSTASVACQYPKTKSERAANVALWLCAKAHTVGNRASPRYSIIRTLAFYHELPDTAHCCTAFDQHLSFAH